MEYHDGAKPLKKLIGTPENPFQANPLSLIDAVIELLEGLKVCEGNGVTHRDLSPGNVLLVGKGVKVIDFGCCHMDLPEAVTLTDENLGTPNYRPPECEGYSDGKPDIRADLYAVGKLIWALLVNKQAFPREMIWDEGETGERLRLRHFFQDDPDQWHFTSLLQGMVKHSRDSRSKNTDDALAEAKSVRRLITHRYLPVEALAMGWCPVCGNRKMIEYMKACPNYWAEWGPTQDTRNLQHDRFVCRHCG